jgi:hypothetical protein
VKTHLLLAFFLLEVAACSSPATRRHRDDDDDDETHDPTSSGGAHGPGGSGVGGVPGNGGAGGSGADGGGAGGQGEGGTVDVLGPGDLVITEIMNNPAAVVDDDGEWFEIYNATGSTIDLAGLAIRHQPDATPPHVIGESVLVAPGTFAVLARRGDARENGGVVADYEYGAEVSLNNSLDTLAIETADGVVIDVSTWDETSGLDPDGASRELGAMWLSAAMNDDDSHFCAAASLIPGSSDYGTPGAANGACP